MYILLKNSIIIILKTIQMYFYVLIFFKKYILYRAPLKKNIIVISPGAGKKYSEIIILYLKIYDSLQKDT